MEEYFDSVSRMVDAQLEQGIGELKNELMRMVAQKGYTNISQDKIDEACNKLLYKTQSNFLVNMSKFKLYSIRNVFTPSQQAAPVPVAAPSSSSSSVNSAKDNAHHEMDRTLESLRQRYIALQRDYLQVATECRDMDALLKDMRSALFNLRVAIQSFEDYEISPLSETTNILNQYKARLRECSEEATTLLQKFSQLVDTQPMEVAAATEEYPMEVATSHDLAEGFEPIVHDMDQIRTGSMDSIFQLAAGMQRKNGGRM